MNEAEPLTGDDATAAALIASRALLGVVARSIAAALEVVTLPQFRVLVVLRSGGPLRMGALAERMKANPSTFTRFVDRMVEAGWLERRASPGSRREVLIDLTPHGAQIVDHVSDRRRRELDAIVSALPSDERRLVLEGLQRFARAAGEPHADDLLVLGL